MLFYISINRSYTLDVFPYISRWWFCTNRLVKMVSSHIRNIQEGEAAGKQKSAVKPIFHDTLHLWPQGAERGGNWGVLRRELGSVTSSPLPDWGWQHHTPIPPTPPSNLTSLSPPHRKPVRPPPTSHRSPPPQPPDPPSHSTRLPPLWKPKPEGRKRGAPDSGNRSTLKLQTLSLRSKGHRNRASWDPRREERELRQERRQTDTARDRHKQRKVGMFPAPNDSMGKSSLGSAIEAHSNDFIFHISNDNYSSR